MAPSHFLGGMVLLKHTHFHHFVQNVTEFNREQFEAMKHQTANNFLSVCYSLLSTLLLISWR